MRGCPGCGTELLTAGCPNTECGMSMGGTYVTYVNERAALLRQKVAAMTDEECAQLWERLKAL